MSLKRFSNQIEVGCDEAGRGCLAGPVIAAAVIVFIPTIGDYVTPKLVGGPSGLMISNMIQLQFLKANNAPLGATLAILAMFAVVVTLALLWIFGKVFAWFNRNYFGILR